MQVTKYQGGGGESATIDIAHSMESVHIQAQQEDSCAVLWSSLLEAEPTVRKFEQLVGDVALGPNTEIIINNWQEDSIGNFAALTRLIEGPGVVKAMFLDVGGGRLLHWMHASEQGWKRHRAGFSAQRGSLDFTLLGKLIEATGSPGVVGHQQVIDDKAKELLADYASP